MKIYKDRFTKEEVCSDAYEHLAPFGNAALLNVAFELKSNKIARNDDCGIAANVDEDAEAGMSAEADVQMNTVIDLMDTFGYKNFALDKDAYKLHIKEYTKRVIEKLKADDPAAVDAFKKDMSQFVKVVLEKFDEIDLYVIDTSNEEPMIIYERYEDEELAPRYIFIRHGLEEEKC